MFKVVKKKKFSVMCLNDIMYDEMLDFSIVYNKLNYVLYFIDMSVE